jgi:hypothetical protein
MGLLVVSERATRWPWFSVVLHGILQRSAHSSVVMQGRADRTYRANGRARLGNHFWAGFTIDMLGFDLRQGQGRAACLRTTVISPGAGDNRS